MLHKRLSRKYLPDFNFRIKKFKLSKLSFIVKVLFILFLLTAVYIFTNYFFKVTKITNLSGININNLDRYYQKNIFTLNKDEIIKQIISNNPQLEFVEVNIGFPNNIVINAKKAEPVISLKVVTGYYILSTSGKIIYKLNSDQQDNIIYPAVNFYQKYYYQQYKIGEYIINPDIISAINLATELKKYNLEVKTIDIVSSDMILLHNRDILYVFSTKKDIKSQFGQFLIIYKKIKQENLAPEKVDFRFNKPILSF